MSYFGNVNVQANDTFSIDAFGRWRTSTPSTLFDSDIVGGEFSTIWSTVTSGTGVIRTDLTGAYTNETILSVVGGAGYAISQTFQRFKYQPGKSQLIIMTFNMQGHTLNVIKTIGYYNTLSATDYTAELDGIYLRSDGVNASLNVSKGSTGNTTSIPQSAWNVDKFNGNGPSRVTLDWTKAQILFIDFEWLGVGRVRAGFVVDGKIYYAHTFDHANNIRSIYMDSPHHSVRYEIRTTSAATGRLDKICSSVQSEGGITPLGVPTSIYTGVDGITMAADTPELVCGIRINPSKPYTLILPTNVSTMTETANANYVWFLCANPTYSGTPITWTNIGDTASKNGIQGATAQGDNIVSNFGLILASGHAATTSRNSSTTINNIWKPGVALNGITDEMWLVVRPVNNATVHGSIDAIVL